MSDGQGTDRRSTMGPGVVVVLGGLALAFLASFRPLWYWSNPWIGSERVDPSLPAGMFDGVRGRAILAGSVHPRSGGGGHDVGCAGRLVGRPLP